MERARASGILLHPTSLPGPFGIGDLGPEAERFVEFLAETGQSLWQVLPLGPTGFGNSPYMSFSAFGGNRLLVSPERLVADGLLDPADLEHAPPVSSQRVDFPRAIELKTALLRKSFERFEAGPGSAWAVDLAAFRSRNASWLEDYALFMALKDAHGGRVWTAWEEGAARREPAALARWRDRLAREARFYEYVQFLFARQWAAIRDRCHALGVRIVGDVPIYVAHDSAEVWANRDHFLLDERGHPSVIAGVPPDYFSATGQRWGNPIYHWAALARTGYRWWVDRFRVNFSMADLVRLDHFRGFEAYWEVPAAEATAVNGRWVKGPGDDLFGAVRAALGDLPIIAEDLGLITPEVDALRDRLGFPGMRILQMAFGDDPKASEYLPHNHVRNCAVYTATHDHNTTVGWFTAPPGTQSVQTEEQVARERDHALRYAACDGREIHWDFVRLALGSVARLAIFPLQDVLGCGTEARMNLPGTLRGNWEWRCELGALTPTIRRRLRELTGLYERAP